ncbi:MAG: hypothetical protein IKG08_08200 [Eubacterium sp.]|nr:hypothetical protein [Eubacterium sp.]
MNAVSIDNIKPFMESLLLSDRFDNMLVTGLKLVTFTAFETDGSRRKDYYDSDEEEGSDAFPDHVFWRELKSFVLSLVKGSKPPVFLSLSLACPPRQTEKLIEYFGLSAQLSDVDSLNLNIVYRDRMLTVISAVSWHNFTADRTLDRLWDEYTAKHMTF